MTRLLASHCTGNDPVLPSRHPTQEKQAEIVTAVNSDALEQSSEVKLFWNTHPRAVFWVELSKEFKYCCVYNFPEGYLLDPLLG